ncbi:pentapeptide repeat-containing protein [Humibacter antri]
MPRAKTVQSPRIDPVLLEGLTDADPSELRARRSHETLRFVSPGEDSRALAGADIPGIDLSECELVGLDLSDAKFIDSRMRETRLDGVSASVLAAQGADWRDVELLSSRLGAIEVYESTWNSVRLHGCKLGFVNLRASELIDVSFEDCTIGELDLGGATAHRVAFAGCRIGVLEASHARLTDVDLRGADIDTVHSIASLKGATVSFEQLMVLAPALAGELGLRVE